MIAFVAFIGERETGEYNDLLSCLRKLNYIFKMEWGLDLRLRQKEASRVFHVT